MAFHLLVIIALMGVGFVLARTITGILAQKLATQDYQLKYDMWLYMLLLLFLGWSLIAFFSPNFYDSVNPTSALRQVAPIGLSLLIYGAYLLDSRLVLNLMIATASVLLVIDMPPENFAADFGLPDVLSYPLAIILTYILTSATFILNACVGVLNLFALTICIGLSLMSLQGGLPLCLGFLAAYFGGVMIGIFDANAPDKKLQLNHGACACIGFLLSGFLLWGSSEFAAPSMLILTSFFWAEVLVALFKKYVLRRVSSDMAELTITADIYQKGLPLQNVWFSLIKIGLINIILACFQLYAENALSLPLLAFLINLFLLNRLSRAFDEPTTLKKMGDALRDDFSNLFKKGDDE